MREIKVPYKWCDGKAVFVVPAITNKSGVYPRAPRGGWTAFYTTDWRHSVIVASKTAESYLGRCKYARRIGIARYDASCNDEHTGDHIDAIVAACQLP